MPQAIPLAAAAFVAATEVTGWTAFFIMAGSSIVSGLLQQSLQDQPSDPGIRLNTRSTSDEIPVVYGQDLVGGTDVVIEPETVSYHSLWIVQTLSEDECEGIAQDGGVDQVFLDDKLPSEYGTYGGGDNVQYWFVPGSFTQDYTTTDGLSHLNAGISTYTENYRGTALIIWKLHYSPDNFNSVPRRTVLLKGRKLYDFRDASTAWSDNPVLALYDYMTNDVYGLGYPTSVIDGSSWTAAANYCDAKGWTINNTFRQRNSWDVIAAIVKLFRGQLVWYDGKFYLRYADLNYESSVLTITDDHILQDEQGRASLSLAQPSRFNRPDALRGAYINPDKHYTIDHVIVGETLGNIENIDLVGAIDKQHVSDLTVYNLERRQLDRIISGIFRDDAIQLEPHDVVTFNSTALGISSQLMRVQQADIQPNGLISLSLQYEESTLYDDDYDIDTEGIYDCDLPDPFDVAAPSNLACTASIVYLDGQISPTSKIVLTWDAAAAEDIEKYVLQYKLSADSDWLALGNVNVSPTGENTTFTYHGLPSGDYDFRVAARNEFGYQSAWDTITNETVGDVSGAMPDVSNLELINTQGASSTDFVGGDARFKWDASGDARFQHYKIVIKDTDTPTPSVVRTEYAADNHYTYTYEMHVEDIGSSLVRSFTIEVYEEGTDGQISTTPATLTVTNPAPTMAGFTPTITAGFKSVLVDWSAFTPTDEDLQGYRVFGDTTDGSTDLEIAADKNTKKYRIDHIDVGTTFYAKIMPFDPFGDGTVSEVANGTPVLLDGSDVDIAATLAGTITMTDSDSHTAEQLAPLYDFDLGTTVYSYSNGDWIQYAFGIYEYINRVIVCTNDANGRVYIGITDQDDVETFYKAEADHTADGDNKLILASNESDAQTNYWQLADGYNAVFLPDNVVGKSCKLYFGNSTATAICELLFVRAVIAEQVVAINLASLSTKTGHLIIDSDGSIQTQDFSDVSETGFQIDTATQTVKSYDYTWTMNWNNVGGTDIPEPGATDGATWGSDITDQPSDNDLLNNRLENGIVTIPRPVGGMAYSNSSPQTGAIKITLPVAHGNAMVKFYVDVYEYGNNSSFSLLISGYTGLAGNWGEGRATISGSTTNNNRVRFGYDNFDNCCVVIGDIATTWGFPRVVVRDFTASFGTLVVTSWDDGWAVTWITSVSGYTFGDDLSDNLVDATAILDQGDLATQNSANWNQVGGTSGSSFANELNSIHGVSNNADPTETTVETGFSIHSGGITIQGGGKLNSYGRTTYNGSTGGWFLGYSGGYYQFGIGDGSKSLWWSGTDLVVNGDIIATGNVKANNINRTSGAYNSSSGVIGTGGTWTTCISRTIDLGTSDTPENLLILACCYFKNASTTKGTVQTVYGRFQLNGSTITTPYSYNYHRALDSNAAQAQQTQTVFARATSGFTTGNNTITFQATNLTATQDVTAWHVQIFIIANYK